MRSFRKELWFEIPSRRGFLNITPQVAGLPGARAASAKGCAWSTPCTSPPRSSSTTTRRGLHHDYDQLAGEAGAARAGQPLPAQPHRRGQRRRAPEAQVMGREVVVAVTEGQAGLRPVGADLLRRVRRAAAQAGAGEDHRGVDGEEFFCRMYKGADMGRIATATA